MPRKRAKRKSPIRTEVFEAVIEDETNEVEVEEVQDGSMKVEVKVMSDDDEVMLKGPKDLANLPLDSIDEYREYNRWARVFKKPVKFPPVDMHPHRKIRFTRSDGQNGNVLPVRRRDGEQLIDFEMTLEDGKEYDLPIPIINFINKLGVPKYKQVTYPDGTHQTVYSHTEMRFACQAIYD